MRRYRLHRLAALILSCLWVSAALAGSRCRLIMSAPLPVKIEDLRPVISADINGVAAPFIVDTGSFFDFLSPAAAAQFKLPLGYAPPWYYVSGVGGSVIPRIATAKTFSVAGITAHDTPFLVGDNDFGGGQLGLIGQNLFRATDMEFDFANGAIRFVKPQHCGDAVLTYWATNEPIGVVKLRPTSKSRPDIFGRAAVNGHEIKVLFDTGSPRSILSLAAARRAGITPQSPGVTAAGLTSGMGKRTIQVWSAPIDKFEIGGEAIEHTHILIGGLDPADLDADMLLGTDFFLAHHIYVAYSQDKLYFTYNGGPVFDLNARPPKPTATAPGTAGGGTTAAASAAPAGAVLHSAQSPEMAAPIPVSDAPADAEGFMRRALAERSRGEFSAAIADFTSACRQAAADADCRYQRGVAYQRNHNPRRALADFDDAVKLAPGDYEAYLARAELQLPTLHAGIAADLDAVDRLAPPQSDLRLHLASLYSSIGQYRAGAHQLDLWIQYHPRDNRFSDALGFRCWARAAADVQLEQALADCNQALRTDVAAAHSMFWRLTHRAPPGPDWLLRNRSLVYLRLGQWNLAIADDDAALAQIHDDEERAYPLYLRAVAELRKGRGSKGQADLAAARKLAPGIDKHYAKMGLAP